MCGWIYLETKKGKWQRRFCEVCPDAVYYARDPKVNWETPYAYDTSYRPWIRVEYCSVICSTTMSIRWWGQERKLRVCIALRLRRSRRRVHLRTNQTMCASFALKRWIKWRIGYWVSETWKAAIWLKHWISKMSKPMKDRTEPRYSIECKFEFGYHLQ